MAMLTGPEIERMEASGRIVISPFDPSKVNPNSCNLTLSDKLLVYKKFFHLHDRQDVDHAWRKHGHPGASMIGPEPFSEPLDMAVNEEVVELTISPEGLVLWPGVLYLASTVEHTETHGFAPALEGRSSVGRLGIGVHVTAGFGDDGFRGTFTMEMTVVHPVRVYAGVGICQIAYFDLAGECRPYAGKYVDQKGPRSSGLWKELAHLLPGSE